MASAHIHELQKEEHPDKDDYADDVLVEDDECEDDMSFLDRGDDYDLSEGEDDEEEEDIDFLAVNEEDADMHVEVGEGEEGGKESDTDMFEDW